MHRVEKLADRPEGFAPPGKIPFKNMVPLDEIIADSIGKKVGTKAVAQEYQRMIQSLGPELGILFDRTADEMKGQANPEVVEGILRVRDGGVEIEPGYDGVYGKVKIFRARTADLFT